ncbi:hypothetical protein EST38_g10486 [Candolleomyces aberdarensis]|uniref:Nephrocystin 3-like N-terminal domain-containing protein n=1 Tax=Candolleomyces aberdarensis TaxID=2316362 RepID=A0A4Q2DAJ3_9AGAR|nr:hypothetical protein EST38_g10486 [Candolleomyces aberdarensis]
MAAARGAVLVSTSPADLEELDNYIKLRGFIIDHARLLYQYANALRELDDDESLYIITGCIKSGSWAMAAFKDPMAPPHDVLRLVKGGGSGPIPNYMWTSRGTASAKSYPDEHTHDYNGKEKNQTLFMHGFKLSFSSAFRSRWNNHAIPGDTDSSKPPSDSDSSGEGGRRDGQDGSSRGSSSKRGTEGDGFAGIGPKSSIGHALSDGMSVRPFPEPRTEIKLHPLDATNRQLLHLTNADFALTHDDDWRFALENRTLDDVDSFDALQTNGVSVYNGVAFLVHGEPQIQDLWGAPNATDANISDVEFFKHFDPEFDGTLDWLDLLRLHATPPERPDMSGKLAKCLSDSRKPDVEKICECGTSFTNKPNAIHASALDISDMGTLDVEGLGQNDLELGLERLDALPKHPDIKPAKHLLDGRKTDVEKIRELEKSSTNLVLFVLGRSGIGKSTVAGHLADEFRLAGQLAASVFLSFFPTVTFAPETIIKMIAHEIGSIHPRTIPKIAEAMNQRHLISLNTLLQKYILEPLQLLNHPQPFIIIIDAMDEWRDHPIFIKALSYLNSQSSVVKFIITGRLDPRASHLPGIDKVAFDTYSLGPVTNQVIETYFEKHLATVPWVNRQKASPADVEKLTELSGGLPVWASTVIALLSHSFSESPPHVVVEEIIRSRHQVDGSDGLRELYRNALSRLFPSQEVQRQLRRYLGATMVLQESLSLPDFSKLSGIPSHRIIHIRFALSAFQTRSPPPVSQTMIHPATTLFHLSFLEYVQATTTSFAISVFDCHSALGLACLKQLVSLLASSQNQSFSLCPIHHYAAKYWMYHVSNGTPRLHDQWALTEHSSMLRKVTADTQQRWATMFLTSLMPMMDETRIKKESGMTSILIELADCLDECGGDQWTFQVACLEVAGRIDDGHAEAWFDLGRCYNERADAIDSLQMREEAVEAFQHALRLQKNPHPDRAGVLDSLASALRSCYQQGGEIDILNEAISHLREALGLRPAPHPDRPHSLNDLAGALSALYMHIGDAKALNEAVSLYREALLCPDDRSMSLNNLATSLRALFECNGDIDALHEAISLYREALPLCPPPHPDCSILLNNLAVSLQLLFQHNKDVGTLQEVISLHRQALALCPGPHPDRCIVLNDLANALRSLYECGGDIQTLNEAVSLYNEALALFPASHPYLPQSLNNLAHALLFQYEQDGAMEVLDEAISLRHELLLLHPPGHRFRKYNVELLVELLEIQFEATGDKEDGDEIEALKAELAAMEAKAGSEPGE